MGSPAPRVSRPSTIVVAGSSRCPCSRIHAAMPPMPDSSQPVSTSRTSVCDSGSAASRRASSITAATPVALSLAPGTVAPR